MINNMPKVVIDTNVILSALFFTKKVAKPRQMWHENQVIPLISQVTVAELIQVLAYPKFSLTVQEQEDLLADYIPFCETVKMPKILPIIPSCRDVNDEPFLLLALVGNADYLITGDDDLLSLQNSFTCSIITVNQFLSLSD
ncbi:MAG: putative toxin-antitoxin system toxin component, PIN family [Cyanobacterium sp. T60_A2020_053]|nr:putative toxin-antitoxin system toxin component, PIN family [Cyanobacterium sp. T60_A2020_053]